jgi:hypothetical protein
MATLLRATNQKTWTNRHETFTERIDNLFDIANPNTGNAIDDYNSTTTTIQRLLGMARLQNKGVRALGGGWSFTKVAVTDGWIINTKQLNLKFNIRDESIDAAYTGRRNHLLFAQCGTSVQELNTYLRARSKSLKTCGASNGQTIVGAFSTGTHGSAIDFGATPDFVVALHIVISEQEHVWLERSSYPVASDALIAKLNTRRIRNDEIFNAALVSFGSFGFIHGAMIETEDIYLLECYRLKLPLDASLKNIMNTLDFTNAANLPHGSERPFHFQVVVNQFDIPGGTYSSVMYKRPFRANYQPPVIDDPMAAGPGDDVPAFLGKVTDLLPVVTPQIVNQLVKQSYKLYNNVEGTCGEIFSNNNIRGKVLSTALGIPAERAVEVNDLLIQINNANGPFTGIFSYRYSKKSSATLAFTRYDQTLILELDGVESGGTRNFYTKVWSELQNAGIPFTFHWGKVNNLDAAMTRTMYGNDMDKWISARNQLLPPESQQIFNNQTIVNWGLSG